MKNRNAAAERNTDWWRNAVIYQIYPRSFADANGDGIGDLPGITSRLQDLSDLGVDAVWLSPFFTSPQADAGYDVQDFCDVDPLFGNLADFDTMLEKSHELQLKVIIDIVPNHTSDEHVWFQAALNSEPGSAARERYIFRDGKGPDGSEPPNNWQSVFYGPAWTRVQNEDGSPGQWYLHLFDDKQPDLNWRNPEVHQEFERILRFWLDRGVDGFRVDVARGLVKQEGLPDYPVEWQMNNGEAQDGTRSPFWDRDEVHEIYRDWRKVLDEYPGDRILVAEAYVEPPARLARYVRPDEMHQAFNFEYMKKSDHPQHLREVVDASLLHYGAVGAPSTWVLNNHDNVRHTSRLGLSGIFPTGAGIGPDDPQPDHELGLRKARAATAVMLALPGSAYIYQGEELGLPEVTQIAPSQRQDPTFARSQGKLVGRDGCRVPIPWDSSSPTFGFNDGAATWLPIPSDWGQYARSNQGAPDSTLNFYRTALKLRREFKLGDGTLSWRSDKAADILEYEITGPGCEPVSIIANYSSAPTKFRAREILLVSDGSRLDRIDAHSPEYLIQPNTTVWYLNEP